MIFGWGKPSDDDGDDDEEEIELVQFLGAMNGGEADLAGNRRLVDAGLVRAKEVVSDGMARRANEIRVEPKGERSQVTIVVDGMPYPGERLSKPEGLAVTQMLKLLACLDVKGKQPQNGGIKAEFSGDKYEVWVRTGPAEGGGEKLLIRIINQKSKLDSPSDIGMPESLKLKIRSLCNDTGLFVVAGPPNSGTTTTCYATLRGLDAYTSQIFTTHDTGGRKLENINRFEWKEGDDLEQTIQRVIRVDANVIMVEPLMKAELAQIYFKFTDKVMLFTEMTTRDTPTALLQIAKWLGNAKPVADAVRGVLSQKLLRALCTECRQAYKPNAAFLKKAGLPETVKVLYRKPKPVEGEPEEPDCDKCGGLGYYGRVAMFELLEMTDGMKEALIKTPEGAALRTQMRKDKMLLLQNDGLRLVAEGKTSLEELQRVFKAP